MVINNKEVGFGRELFSGLMGREPKENKKEKRPYKEKSKSGRIVNTRVFGRVEKQRILIKLKEYSEFLSTYQISKILGITKKGLYYWMYKGWLLPVSKTKSGRLVWLKEDLIKFLTYYVRDEVY